MPTWRAGFHLLVGKPCGPWSPLLCHSSGGDFRRQAVSQFWINDGPLTNYSGKADVKQFLDFLTNSKGYSKDLWVSRIEVGSEIDDSTSGSVKLKNISFEINGTSKGIELAK